MISLCILIHRTSSRTVFEVGKVVVVAAAASVEKYPANSFLFVVVKSRNEGSASTLNGPFLKKNK
jgi:hypothetical protein